MKRSTVDAAAIRLMGSQHQIALVAQLLQLGMSHDQIALRVRKGIFVRVARGVVALGPPSEAFPARAIRYIFTAGANAVAGWWTAAQLHGLDAPRERQIHAVVPGNRPRDPSPDLYVHRTRYLPPDHVTEIQAIPTTSLARTIADCASRLDRWSALRMLDSCSASPAVWRTIHVTATDLSNGRPGVNAIVEATHPDGADRFRSALERSAREALRRYGVPDGEWNKPMGDANGHIREIDLAYPESRLAIEYDGLMAHRGRLAAQRDRATDRRLLAIGWRVLRYTWQDVVHRPAVMAQEIVRALGTG